jgi:uncharacterized membrane protein YfcA
MTSLVYMNFDADHLLGIRLGGRKMSTIGFIAALGLVAGLLIGCVGVGGVILVPALAYLGGIPIHTAIPAVLAAFLVSGVVGSFSYWRAGSVPWSMAKPLFIGAVPAALAGALTSSVAPAGLLEASIGLLTAVSGFNLLFTKQPSDQSNQSSLSSSQLWAAGSVTGFASALTGTGGPLVLVPILIWLKCPVLASVGMAQVIQLPIALLATAGNVAVAPIDWILATTLALGLAFGTWGGAKIAHDVPRTTLRVIVATVLSLVGAIIIIKVFWRNVVPILWGGL